MEEYEDHAVAIVEVTDPDGISNPNLEEYEVVKEDGKWKVKMVD